LNWKELPPGDSESDIHDESIHAPTFTTEFQIKLNDNMEPDMKLEQRAIEAWGEEAQIGMLYEEMGELMTAIQHYRRGKTGKEEVLGEIVDVQLMLQQMEEIFTEEGMMYTDIYAEKLAELEQRVNDAEGEE
jgi:NTP pyrophosphatase (non-canonical NTP hydrolase)